MLAKMITATEAKRKLLDNPSFERKVELYAEVNELINEAIENHKKSFHLTEEQHRALHKELITNGYTQPSIQIFIGFGGTHPYTYNI